MCLRFLYDTDQRKQTANLYFYNRTPYGYPLFLDGFKVAVKLLKMGDCEPHLEGVILFGA